MVNTTSMSISTIKFLLKDMEAPEKLFSGSKFPDITELYKKHVNSFWTEDIFHFDEDLQDWETLSAEKQHFVKHILAFFAKADLLVADNLVSQFLREVDLKESQDFYAIQNLIERIHNETYEKMLNCFVGNLEERARLNVAHLTIPSIKAKADWAQKWMDARRPFGERLLAFICIEGIHFCTSFAGIYWIKDQGLMKQLCKSNEYISRDESLHVMHGMTLFKHLSKKPEIGVIHQIIGEAVELEKEFCTEAIPCNFSGLNTGMMQDYVEFIANQYLETMGLDLLYKKKSNPLGFMTKVTAKIQNNFFESENADYSLSTDNADNGDYDF